MTDNLYTVEPRITTTIRSEKWVVIRNVRYPKQFSP